MAAVGVSTLPTNDLIGDELLAVDFLATDNP